MLEHLSARSRAVWQRLCLATVARKGSARRDPFDISAFAWRWVVGGLLSIAVAALTIGYAVHQREAALREAERELRNLTLTLANWVEDGFRSVEQLEVGIAEWLRAEGVDSQEKFDERLATRQTYELLRGRIESLPRVSRLFLVNHEGQNVANTVSFPTPNLNSLGRDYFEALRTNSQAEIFLSAPSRNRVDGQWSVFMSRRLHAADGRFLGIVVAGIDLTYFERIFGELALGPGSSIGLIRRDGLLLARHPWREDAIGSFLNRVSFFNDVLLQGGSGAVRTRSTIDGADKIIGVRMLDRYPLVVAATRAVDQVLAPWRADAQRWAVLALIVESAILGGVLLAGRLARQQQALMLSRTAQIEAEAKFAVAEARALDAQLLADREAALRAIFDNGTAGIVEVQADPYRILRVNHRYCEITQRTEEDLLSLPDAMEVIHPDDRERFLQARQASSAWDSWDVEIRYLQPNGKVCWARVSVGVSARDEYGEPIRFVSIVQDVTESREATERLREREALLRMGQEVGRIGSFTRDLATGEMRCGPDTRRLFGLPEDGAPLSFQTWVAAILPEDRDRFLGEFQNAIATRVPEIACNYRMRRPSDGSLRHVEMRERYLRDTGGHPTSSVGIAIDVTEAREAEALLRLSMAVGRIGEFRHDWKTGLVYPGAEARVIHGLAAGAGPVTEADWLSTMLPDDRSSLPALLGREFAKRNPEATVSYRIALADGNLRHVEARARVDYDAEGRPATILGVVIDVTESRQAEARIAHMARHDMLTGLPNRLLFRERLDHALARARRGEDFALLCLDLDRFKEVNDTLGHPVGDELLCAVAHRLKAEIREVDTLARLGGDEFAILLACVRQPHQAAALAKRIVETLSAPFALGDHHLTVGTSIGIAVAPSDATDPDALLKGADMALYRAKEEGRGRWSFFEPEMNARAQSRRILANDLRRALAAGEFELFYQPIMAAAEGHIVGAEALMRWRHPDRGLIPPNAFIPLAEEIGLIEVMGQWALRQACADAVTWPGSLRVAVNLSPIQFAGRDLAAVVAAALDSSGLPPERLELEITETAVLRDTDATISMLHRLKALGLRIALDDFGTGYSSMSYLQRFPFSKVKIDRSFIRGLEHSQQNDVIVRAITTLCAGLGMTTTAEGVETYAQLDAVRRIGCTEAQGYLFSEPRPMKDLTRLMVPQAWNERGSAPREQLSDHDLAT